MKTVTELRASKHLSTNMEDYAKTIFNIIQKKKVARIKDIARNMGIKMPSVTAAVKKLCNKGLVTYEPYGYITLTPQGDKIAREICRRHEVIEKFLIKVLHISSEIAAEDACRMEHVISDETFDKMRDFLNSL